MKISIKLSNGKVLTETFQPGVITMGRSSRNNFVIPDESLSRQHCQIEYVNGELFITDLGSANGVYFAEERLPPNQRIKIDTFLQLTLGQLECVLEVDEPTNAGFKVPTATANPNATSFTSTKKIPVNRPEKLPEEAKPEKSSLKQKLTFPLLVGIIILITGVYLHFSQEPDPSLSTDPNAGLVKNIPKKFGQVPDAFLSSEQYLDKDVEKSCRESKICEQLGIKDEQTEGIVKTEKEYFVFFNPDRLRNEDKFKKIKDHPEFREIVALYSLLKSDVMKKFANKEVAQVHLIIRLETFKHIKAFRFHTMNYAGSEEKRLLNELGDVLRTGSTDQFWVYAKPIIKTKEL